MKNVHIGCAGQDPSTACSPIALKNSHFRTFGNGCYLFEMLLFMFCGRVFPGNTPCDCSFVMLSGSAKYICQNSIVLTSYFNAVSVTPASFNLASVSSSVCVRISAYSMTVSRPAFFKSITESLPILSAVRSVMIAS